MKIHTIMRIRIICVTALPAAVLILAGCNGSDNTISGTAGAGSGTLSLAVADTPVDSATSVVVAFTGVQLQGPSGSPTEFDFTATKQIDLMATSQGNSAVLLDGVTVPAGDYQWIRLLLDVNQSTIGLDNGSVHALTIPSGSNTGLKLVSGFTVAAGGQADFTIDFNLRQAVTLANGGSGTYLLKPALRLVDNQAVGKIAGTVSHTLTIGSTTVASADCGPAVYIYSGANVTPVDINPASSIQPISTATLSLNNATGDYDYAAAFLAPGDYTLAVTCATGDDPDVVDPLVFTAGKNATVSTNATSTVDFP
jgi:hypothetical protein